MKEYLYMFIFIGFNVYSFVWFRFGLVGYGFWLSVGFKFDLYLWLMVFLGCIYDNGRSKK